MENTKGKLIVIEGADGSGKQTQAKMLVERLNSSGVLGKNRAHFWSFPTYEDPVWGKLLKEYLTSDQKADEVDPKYASLLYAADRGKASVKIKELLAKGDWVICDRYAQSNMAHQGAKIADLNKRQDFLKWLEDMEFVYFNIPKADKIIYLSLPIEVSQRRSEERLRAAQASGEALGDKVKAKDIHEQDSEYLQRVRAEYQRLAEVQGWEIIECVEGEHELSREKIAEKVWSLVLTLQQHA